MSRAYIIEPVMKKAGDKGADRYVLALTEDGEECGGGVFPLAVDSSGFDAGYQDAIDAGEEWMAQ